MSQVNISWESTINYKTSNIDLQVGDSSITELRGFRRAIILIDN